jgi:hypothetical protein
VKVVLNNFKPAMKPGYSRFIAEEYILPDRNATLLACVTDMTVMTFCAGIE